MNQSNNLQINDGCKNSAQILLGLRDNNEKTIENFKKAFGILQKKENKTFENFKSFDDFRTALLQADNKIELWKELETVFFE
jgi:hypothetical protein